MKTSSEIIHSKAYVVELPQRFTEVVNSIERQPGLVEVVPSARKSFVFMASNLCKTNLFTLALCFTSLGQQRQADVRLLHRSRSPLLSGQILECLFELWDRYTAAVVHGNFVGRGTGLTILQR
jgi:hypothetical protein